MQKEADENVSMDIPEGDQLHVFELHGLGVELVSPALQGEGEQLLHAPPHVVREIWRRVCNSEKNKTIQTKFFYII